MHLTHFSRCHHQIIYAKINFKVHFPPVYKRLVWDYKKANVNLIKRSLAGVDWVNLLNPLSVNDQVDFSTQTILNVLSNFTQNNTVSCREKYALWMTNQFKRVLLDKAKLYTKYVKNGRSPNDYINLQTSVEHCSNLIKIAKKDFYDRQGRMLNNPNIGQKRYWSILNSFLHKQKVPKIPPINSNGVFVTDFREKASLFNKFFAEQCTLVDTPSVLPAFSYQTNHIIDSVEFNINEIVSLIKCLDCSKAHGWDDISTRMLKICDDFIGLPLKIIFEKALNAGQFPDKWKKANVIPTHKKADKNILKDYRPVSLLPIFGKLFEKCVF